MKVSIITPTTGKSVLAECIQSVRNQTYKDVEHIVVVDGRERWEAADAVLKRIEFPGHNEHLIALPYAVGAGGWYGHRVYAASSFLVNSDLICYLDEDNWFEPNHVESLVKTIQENNYDWAYSLRKIYDGEGSFVCNDDCESLGKWKVFSGERHHIDTCCYMVKREVAVALGHSWYGQWGADRQFMSVLMQYAPNFGGSGEYTACYRLDGNSRSVNN